MADRIQTLSASLVAAGAGPGSPIGVFQCPSADWICSMLAILRIGATYVPLDLANSLSRLASIAALARPTILLTDTTTSPQTPALAAPNAIEIIVSNLPRYPAANATPHPNAATPTSTAILLFTSGTTGAPKGVLLTHANLATQLEGSARFRGVPPSHRAVVLQQTVFSFDLSLEQIFAALAHGGTLAVVPAEARGDPLAVTGLVRQWGVTYTLATPSEYHTWLAYARETVAGCDQWRVALACGEPLAEGVVEGFGALVRQHLPRLTVWNLYGPTEATVAVTSGVVDVRRHRAVEVGRVVPNNWIVIVDGGLAPVPAGVMGEVCIGGVGVAGGYLPAPGVSQGRFVEGGRIHAKLEGTGRWYRTGDMGLLRLDGELEVLGRVAGDSQVKMRGFRVEVKEVEAAVLAAGEGALTHAVVTPRGSSDDRFLAAHVVFDPEVPAERREEVLRRLESRRLPLPSYMRPAVVVPMDRVPLTRQGKLDRNAVRDMALPERSESQPAGSALGPVEETMAELWGRVIPHNMTAMLTPETSFFDVGGTSILLVKLRALVQAEMHSAPRLAEFVNASTLGGMARLVNSCAVLPPSIDWEGETALPESVSSLARTDITNNVRLDGPGASVAILLSGATGYLGRHLLTRFVLDPRVDVVRCLVRNPSAVLGSTYPRSLQQIFSSSKIELVQADLSQPNFGLRPDDFAALADEVAAVVHCAADRAFFENYHGLRAVNVNSVKELARIALLAGGVPLHFLSSGAVAKYDGTAPPCDGTDGYVASKWAAETFLRRVAPLGLRAYLHRPQPLLVEDVKAIGHDDPVLEDMVRITREIGKRPDFSTLHGHVDLAPVERVVEDITAAIFSRPVGEADSDDAVKIVLHAAGQRLPAAEFLQRVDEEETLRRLPAVDPLAWFGEAKRAGFAQLMTAQDFVIASPEGRLASRR